MLIGLIKYVRESVSLYKRYDKKYLYVKQNQHTFINEEGVKILMAAHRVDLAHDTVPFSLRDEKWGKGSINLTI